MGGRGQSFASALVSRGSWDVMDTSESVAARRVV